MEAELKVGGRIAAFRKAKGMTQEQLAGALGVSPPAVSKWETGSSYPDITLLCPLARALGTDPGRLLEFEESLPEEEMAARINTVVETARRQGAETAEAMLEELLHQYPGSASLQYQAAAVFTFFQMLFPDSSEEQEQEWKRRRKELLQSVRRNGPNGYWQPAVSQLASLALTEGELQTAEQLLKELPEHTTDPTIGWAQLYLKQGETEKARQTVQKRLYTLVGQAQMCLIELMEEKLTPDAGQALEICGIYRELETLFGCGGGMSEGLFLELYLRAGRLEDALACLSRYADVLTGPARMPKALLFSPALQTEPAEKEASSAEMRQMILQGLSEEEAFQPVRDSEAYRAAVEKLRASL